MQRLEPQVKDVLERREVLSPFPFIGTFSGSYSVYAEYGGSDSGSNQEAFGTISVTIAVSSTQMIGENSYDAYIYGSVSFTGFVGQNATFPFTGNYNEQLNGLETGRSSSGPEPSVDINISAYYPQNPLHFISIEGYCTNDSIVAGVNIGLGDYFTPNQASVVLAGAGSSPAPSPTPAPVELTGASLAKTKRGTSQIVLDFDGPLGGGSGLPLRDFQLTTVVKGKQHPKTIPLARVAFDSITDRITLIPKRPLNLKAPLNLTISGLSGGPSVVIINKHGASIEKSV